MVNPEGQLVQGSVDEGDDASKEFPVLVAGKDPAGKVRDIPIGPHGGVIVEAAAGGGSQAVTVADCADVTQGCISDGAVTGDNPGTISAKLRGLNKVLADVWDSVNHFLRVSIQGVATVGGTVTANQGTPNAGGANSWPVICDDVTSSTTIDIGHLSPALSPLLNGYGTATVQLSGTWSADLQMEATVDGSNWVQIPCINTATLAVLNDLVTNGLYSVGCEAYWQLRLRVISLTSGSIAVNWRAGAGSGIINQITTPAIFSVSTPIPDNKSNPLAVPVSQAGSIEYFLDIEHRRVSNDGSSNKQYSVVRTPDVFKTATATATGSTALWTPAAGRKFRLMRYRIDITDDATLAAMGRLTVKLLDAAAATNQNLIAFVPAAALDTSGLLATTGWVDLGNGVLSAAANNVLNINLSAVLTAGLVNVVCCGTEEI